MRHITWEPLQTWGALLPIGSALSSARRPLRRLAAPAAIALGVALATGCGADPTAPRPVIHSSAAVITVLPEGTSVSSSRQRAAREDMQGCIAGECYRYGRGGAHTAAEHATGTGGHGGNASAEATGATGGDGGDATSGG
jgi:hypothetical protein